MNRQIIDCRGLSCPQPVLETKKAMDVMQAGTIEVIVDNETACENISLFAAKRDWSVESVLREDENIHITLSRISGADENASGSVTTEKEKYLVYIASDTVGRGNEELGAVLMKAFIKTLSEMSPLPGRIIFLNSGVKLAIEGSFALEALSALENQGVEIFSCGTCLDYFRFKDKLRVGKVTNMFEIVSSLKDFNRVVQP